MWGASCNLQHAAAVHRSLRLENVLYLKCWEKATLIHRYQASGFLQDSYHRNAICLICLKLLGLQHQLLENKPHLFSLTYLFIYLLTYLLTYSMEQSPSWETNRFAASQETPAFYGTRKFITAFTNARHLSLFRASSIQSIPPHPTFWKSILILPSLLHVGLPSGLFPSGFPTKV
jgi:hypothetical protein